MKKLMLILGLLLGLTLFTRTISVVAASAAQEACDGITAAGGSCDSGGAKDAAGDIVLSVINVLSWVVGAVSVVMIIIGGFRYVISGGDSNGISGAKNTILYAIIGLVVVLFAQVIVAFVYKSATEVPATTPPSTQQPDPNAPAAQPSPNPPTNQPPATNPPTGPKTNSGGN